jgi:hypothetical protein
MGAKSHRQSAQPTSQTTNARKFISTFVPSTSAPTFFNAFASLTLTRFFFIFRVQTISLGNKRICWLDERHQDCPGSPGNCIFSLGEQLRSMNLELLDCTIDTSHPSSASAPARDLTAGPPGDLKEAQGRDKGSLDHSVWEAQSANQHAALNS